MILNKKICVVGAGHWGKNHIKTLHGLGCLKAVVDPKKDLLKNNINLYPGINVYTSLEKALLENYDGYVVATPADTHYEIAKEIIKTGKPLLIEKPMTLSVSKAEELINLAEINHVDLMVGHVLLFHPAIIKIKKLIDSGSIGDIQYVYSNRLNLGKVRTQENVFWSFAPHDIAVFQYLINSTPIKVNSFGSSFLQKNINDSTITHLEYKNGTKGHIFVSWLHPFKEHRLVVVGSEAMITFEDSKNDRPLKYHSKKFENTKGDFEKIDGPVKLISYDKKMPLTAELEYFISCINSEKIEISSGKDGLEVVKVLAKASKQLGK